MARKRSAKGKGGGNKGGNKSSSPARNPRPQNPRQQRRAPAKAGSVTKAVQEQRKGSRFLSDMVAELRKVQWPNRKQLMQSTAVVILVVVIVVIYLWAVDSVVEPIVDYLF